MIKDVRNGDIETHITEDQEEYYGFDESDFPEVWPDGRVMLLLSYP